MMEARRQKQETLQKFKTNATKSYEEGLPERIRNRTDVNNLGEIKGEIVKDESFDPIFCALEPSDTYEVWNEEDYEQMHAMLQWEAKSYCNDFEITENLIGDQNNGGNRMICSMSLNGDSLAANDNIEPRNDDEQQSKWGKINVEQIFKTIRDTLSDVFEKRVVPVNVMVGIFWTLWLIWLMLPWGILAVIASAGMVKLLSKDLNENERNEKIEYKNVVKDTVRNGKKLLLDTFLKNKSKVLGKDEAHQVDEMSVVSKGSSASRICVETMMEAMKIQKLKNNEPSHKFNTVEKVMTDEDMIDIKPTVPRMWVMANLEGVPLYVLMDSGATSTSISRRMVEFIEGKIERKLPRLSKKVSCKVFGHAESLDECEVVVINISIGKDVRTARCPFIVNEVDEMRGLIGTNVMAYFGFNLDLGNNKCYITLKEDALEGLVPKRDYLETQNAKLELLDDVMIMEQELVRVPVTVRGRLPKSSSGMFKCTPDVNALENVTAEDVVFREGNVKPNMIMTLKNEGKQPMKFPRGATMGEVLEYRPVLIKNPQANPRAGDYGARRTYEEKCICDLRTDRSVCLIYFTNRAFFSAQEHQCTDGFVTLKSTEKISGNYKVDRRILYIRPNKSGSYEFKWEFLRKYVTKNTRILFSFREEISTEHEKFIQRLRNNSINVHIYIVKNYGECFGCLSLSNFECPDLFKDIQETEIYILDSGTQIENLHRVKAESSPIIEMVFGLYANIQIYRSRQALQIKVHVTNWHKKYHAHRIEVIMGHLLYQLSILKAPNVLSIFTSWQDLGAQGSKQILFALQRSEPWESNKGFELENLDRRDVEVPMAMRNCNCDMCGRLVNFRECLVRPALLNFRGKIDNALVGSRIKMGAKEIAFLQATTEFNGFVEKSEEEYIKLFEETPDYKLDLPPHVDDIAGWEGHEHVRDKLENDEYCVPDLDEIQQSFHQPVNWRDIIKPEQLPSDPELLKQVEEVLDRYNDMFTANKSSWRYFNCEALDAEFTSDETFVSKSFGMNQEKEFILDQKVMNLFNAGFIYEIVEDHPKYVTSKLQAFLVRHNSEAKRNEILNNKAVGGQKVEEETGKRKNLDPNDFRLIVNGKPSNKLIKHPQRYKENMPDMHTILNKIGAYRVFITMDISKAYRSLPASERLQRRFAFICDTSLLRGKVFAFKSVPDGISLAPSFICYIIHKALAPVRHLMPRDTDCFVFIDDIIIAARSNESAIRAWNVVMSALEGLNVLISASKMTVLKNEFQFLGWRMWYDEEEGVMRRSVPADRKNCFARMGEPECKGDVQGAYGSAAFVASACPGLDIRVSALIDTLKIDKKQHEKFELSDVQKRAYRKLLNLLDNLVDLYALDFRKTIFHLSDACFGGLGSLVYQMGKDNKRLPIAYFSKRFPTIVQVQRSSVFKEILAMFWSVEHHKKILKMCDQTVLIVDISSVVSMLRAHIDPTDKQVSRISNYMFAWGFDFMLRQSCGKNLVVADTLSRINREPTTETGVPICQTDRDLDEFFEKYAHTLPKEWTTPGGEGIFNFNDLITHTTVELLKDPKISESVRQKRLTGLLKNIDDKFHPTVLKFLPKDNPLVDMSISKNLEGGGINVCVVEVQRPPVLRQLSDPCELFALKNAGKTVKELSPPVTSALTVQSIIELQRREESTRKVVDHLLSYKPENQNSKIKAKFDLLDSQLLVTKKDNKKEYSDLNLRIYLGPLAALYVSAYLHLCGGHMGQKKLARMFNTTYKCYQSTSIIKTITQSCLACNIYRYPNVINSPEGRIPREVYYPGQLFFIDIVKLDEDLEMKMSDVIACQDSYSGFVWMHPIKSHTVANIATALKRIFTISIIPDKVKCDNESAFASPSFREELKSWGVSEIIYSTANHSQSNARIEAWFARLRALLWLNVFSFRRSNEHDVLYSTLSQLNNAPNWNLAKYFDGRIPPSPANLVFGTPPKYDLIGSYLDNLSAAETIKYRDRYQKIMQEYEKEQAEQHEARGPQKYSAGDKIRPGVFVFVRNPASKKKLGRGLPYFLTEIYEVIRREMRVVYVNKLFGKQRKNSKVNILDVRPVPTNHLIKLLPREVQEVLTIREQGEELKHLKHTPILLKQRLSKPTDHNLRSQAKKPKAKVETEPALRNMWWDESDDDDEENNFTGYGAELVDIQKKQNVPYDPNTSFEDDENEEDDEGSAISDEGNHEENRPMNEGDEEEFGSDNESEHFDDALESLMEYDDEKDDAAATNDKAEGDDQDKQEEAAEPRRGVGFEKERSVRHYRKDKPVDPEAGKGKIKKLVGRLWGGGATPKSQTKVAKTPKSYSEAVKTPKTFREVAGNRNYTSPTPKNTSSPKSPESNTEKGKRKSAFYDPSPILGSQSKLTNTSNYRNKGNSSLDDSDMSFSDRLNQDMASDARKALTFSPRQSPKFKQNKGGAGNEITEKFGGLTTKTTPEKPKTVPKIKSKPELSPDTISKQTERQGRKGRAQPAKKPYDEYL